APAGGVYGVVFSPDGKRLAGASFSEPQTQTVKVWDASTGQERFSVPGGTGDDTFSPAFSPDGKRLAGGARERLANGAWENTVKVWDAQTGQVLHVLKGHTGFVYSAAFHAEGKRLASASLDGTVKVWDVQTGQELFSFKIGPSGGVAFSPDGKRLAS